ncbi:MAG: hypothetical protein RLZZ245_2449 [Verrucomicrobiota bacterium]|jgi:hypothetical protein
MNSAHLRYAPVFQPKLAGRQRDKETKQRDGPIIDLLYKCSWDLEKVFDEFKNKLGEI